MDSGTRRTPPYTHLSLILALSLGAAAVLAPPLGAAPWVVFTEVHYHPLEDDRLEFVEIHLREPPRADLSGWRISGEIDYTFPPGTVILPGEYLVIGRDPGALRRRYPKLEKALGPFSGRLDNKGGPLTLRNAADARVIEFRYDRDGGWTPIPDGTGHTLSILDELLDPGNPSNWRPSLELGGTPGRANGFRHHTEGNLVIKTGDEWKFFRGRIPPPTSWREVYFNDTSWESGPSSIGYGDDDDATLIEDMEDSYLSLYLRRELTVEDPSTLERLVLRVDFDDGFIAYLNGQEVARLNMGLRGTDVAWNELAEGPHEAGVPAQFYLGKAPELLKAGKNVLAVQVHNHRPGSSDLTIAVELESRPANRTGPTASPLINEVHVDPSDPTSSFVEIHNPSNRKLSLAGHALSYDPADPRRFEIPAASEIPPFGFLAFGREELGEDFQLPAGELLITLADIREPEKPRFVDALRVEPPETEAGGEPGGEEARDEPVSRPPAFSIGRYPDGSRDLARLEPPTRGEANAVTTTADLVINEIMYHPISEARSDEYVEIYNRGPREISLAGFRLSGAVRYSFQEGEAIGPAKTLVVARDPDAITRKYGLGSHEVVGPFKGRLSDGGERLLLEDAQGNIADSVAYADRDPWPAAADGGGSSLELIHPALDNSLPSAWEASDESGKSRWTRFKYQERYEAFDPDGSGPRALDEFQVMLLEEGECLIDDVAFGSRRNLLPEGKFESGPGEWTGLGTHEGSRLETGDLARGRGSYRIVALGRGDTRQNHVSRKLGTPLEPGRPYLVSFRARWLGGCPFLLTRAEGQSVAEVHPLEVPERLGSPGRENSRYRPDGRPALDVPAQHPISPSPEEPVTFTLRASAVSSLESGAIHYRGEGEYGFKQVPLERLREGFPGRSEVWRGEVPPLRSGVVEFHISMTDLRGITSRFPAGAPERVAHYSVGLLPGKKFPTLTLLVDERSWEALRSSPRMSNRLHNATLVYGDSRIFYNVGFRRRGSPYTRGGRNWRISFGAESLDGRRSLTVDGQGSDGTRLHERLTYWLLHQLRAPNSRQQYVYFRIPGREEGIYEDVEKISGDYLENWFDLPGIDEEDGNEKEASARSGAKEEKDDRKPRGNLYKVDDWFEWLSGGRRDRIQATLTVSSLDDEDYLWNFKARANGPRHDYEPLIELVKLFDPDITPDRDFYRNVEETVDVDTWLRVLAARTLVDDWDTLGRSRGKNAFLYRSPWDGLWRLLPWDSDLAWRDPSSSLFSSRFPGIRRLLEQPIYRRRFLGYVAYLTERKLDPTVFETVLSDLSERTGAETAEFVSFATARRSYVGSRIPPVPFSVRGSRRDRRSGEPDVLLVEGTAPVLAHAFTLDGRRGEHTFLSAERFGAEFPIGPEGGEMLFQAVDFGGAEVARKTLSVSPRPGALPLPEPEPEKKDKEKEDKEDRDEGAPAPGEFAQGEEDRGEAGKAEDDTAGGTLGSPLPTGDGDEVARVSAPSGDSDGPAAPDGPDGVARPIAVSRSPGRPTEGEALAGDGPETESPPGISDVSAEGTSRRRPLIEGGGEPSLDESPRRSGLETEVTIEELSPLDRPEPPEARESLIPPRSRDAASEPSEPRASRASDREIRDSEEPGGRFPWGIVASSLVVLGVLQAALIAFARKKRGHGGKRARRGSTLHADSLSQVAQDLNLLAADFDSASNALERLSIHAPEDVPALLRALGDERPTHFRKVRRAPKGFRAIPTTVPGSIRVRHIALLFLDQLLGKPPVPRPTQADWVAHWKRRGKR